MENKFIESSYYKSLHNDIAHSYRQVGRALDNYGVDMPKELRGALKGLYEAHRAVLDIMEDNKSV